MFKESPPEAKEKFLREMHNFVWACALAVTTNDLSSHGYLLHIFKYKPID